MGRPTTALSLAVLAVAAMHASTQNPPPREWPVGAATRRFVPEGPYDWRGAATKALVLAALIPRVSLTLLPSVGHYTFLAACTDAGRQAQPQLCADAAGIDRAAIHQRVIESAAQFFDNTLK